MVHSPVVVAKKWLAGHRRRRKSIGIISGGGSNDAMDAVADESSSGYLDMVVARPSSSSSSLSSRVVKSCLLNGNGSDSTISMGHSSWSSLSSHQITAAAVASAGQTRHQQRPTRSKTPRYTVRFDTEATVVNDSKKHRNETTDDEQLLWYGRDEVQQFTEDAVRASREFTARDNNDARKQDPAAHYCTSYTRVLTRTYHACAKNKASASSNNDDDDDGCKILDDRQRKQLRRALRRAEDRFGLEEWLVPVVGKDRTFRRRAVVDMVLNLQDSLLTADGDSGRSSAGTIRGECARISRPSRLVATCLGQALADALYPPSAGDHHHTIPQYQTQHQQRRASISTTSASSGRSSAVAGDNKYSSCDQRLSSRSMHARHETNINNSKNGDNFGVFRSNSNHNRCGRRQSSARSLMRNSVYGLDGDGYDDSFSSIGNSSFVSISSNVRSPSSSSSSPQRRRQQKYYLSSSSSSSPALILPW